MSSDQYSFTIRRYQPADEHAVIRLWQDCELVTATNDPHLDIQRKLDVNPEWFLVGLAQERLVATCMAGYEGHRGWINYLAVEPHYRRKRIATRMMAEAERLLGLAGCPKINLQIRTTNKEVLRFYQRIGYIQDQVLSMGKRVTHK